MKGSQAMLMQQEQELTKPLTRERMGQMLAEVEKQNHWSSMNVVLRSDSTGYVIDGLRRLGDFNDDEEFMELCAELIVKGKQD
jgi:hypothetical protein